MTKDEKESLKKSAVALREVLRRCTNLDTATTIRRNKNEDYDGYFVNVATVNNRQIDIDLFYDFYLGKNKKPSFWVGFFSESQDEIAGLAKAASSVFAVKEVKHPKDISEFDLGIIEYLQSYRSSDDYDYENCFGIYFGPGNRFDLSMAIRFLCEALKAIPGIEVKFDDVDIDVDSLNHDPSLSDSERDQLIKARRGQGEYRAKLENLWGGACSVLGLTTRELLRASHVKPWAICDTKERKDGHNGLLLSAHLDALFDKHLITFNTSGEMQISEKIHKSEQEKLQLHDYRLRKRPWPELERYLTFHRVEFERKRAD